MSAPVLPRRGFLRGLAALPLIGGGVTLIGQPTAAAVPVTETLLNRYDAWLDLERSFLRFHRFGRTEAVNPFGPNVEIVYRNRLTGDVFDMRYSAGLQFDHSEPGPATRAAVILSAAGVPLSGDRA